MIPLATTTIAILRPRAGVDAYDPQAHRTIRRGIRAHIGAPSGRDRHIGGDQSTITDHLDADPCDLQHADRVRDETTGDLFDVVWVRSRQGFGLNHVAAGLTQTVGAANG